MTDRVIGTGLAFDCRIGFHEHEKEMVQRLLIDFEAETDWRENVRSDNPNGIVDYFEVNEKIGQMIASKAYALIETVAEEVARLLCEHFPVSRVRVRVTKRPFDMPNTRSVAVECVRTPADFQR